MARETLGKSLSILKVSSEATLKHTKLFVVHLKHLPSEFCQPTAQREKNMTSFQSQMAHPQSQPGKREMKKTVFEEIFAYLQYMSNNKAK